MKWILLFWGGIGLVPGAAQRTIRVSAKSEFVRVKVPVAESPGENLFARPTWAVGRGREGFFVKKENSYEVQPSRPNAWSLIPVEYDLNGGDFDLRLTVHPVNGRVPFAGLLLSADTSHVPSHSRYIFLTINESGQFVFQHVDAGASEFLVKESSPHIRPDGDNELRLERRDFSIRAYVNGKVVANETFRRLGGRDVFVGVTTDEKARFSGLYVRGNRR